MKNKLLPHKAPSLFATRPGQGVRIILDQTGTAQSAIYMGSGRFTTAYRSGPREVVLYTFYEDLSKSILAQAYREQGLNKNPHLPRIVRIGRLEFDNGPPCIVYRASYYQKVVLKYLSHYNRDIVHALQDAHDEACHVYPGRITKGLTCHRFNEIVYKSAGLPTSLRQALEHLAKCAADWGDTYIFDNFHQRNLGLDGRGNLRLIDPMFDMLKIQEDFDSRKRMKKGKR